MYLRLACLLLLSPIAGCQQQTAEEQAAADIERLGGSVRKDGQLPGMPVITVSLVQSRVSDGELTVLKRFPQLRNLDLRNTKITDKGLEHLEGLTKLQELRLDWTPITDDGLIHLEDLKELRKLSLNNTRIGDTGLVSLQKLTNLEQVSLRGTQVTQKYVERLREALPKADVMR
jgi:hypothetical protein